MTSVMLALDVSNITCRAYYAAASGQNFGVLGIARHRLKKMIDVLIREAEPVRIIGALDAPGGSFRNGLMDGYKGGRSTKPDELQTLLKEAPEIMRELGVELYVSPGYEADDVLATIADQTVPYHWRTVIVTSDQDLLGAVYQGEGIAGIYVLRHESGSYRCYGPPEVEERLGVRPQRVALLKALMGDTSDAIAGVPGIGKVAGVRLAKRYPDMKTLYANLADLTKGERAKFEAVGEAGCLNLERLTTLNYQAPLQLY